MKSILRIAAILLFCATLLPAQITLKVGDPAPALAGGKWIKGTPVKSFERGSIYVVEFWATWCGPCIAAIPHVTDMQKTYAKDGVIFIGQNVWEHNQSATEPFVNEMGDKMDYRVVMDDLAGMDGKMAKTWMDAAGENGIPTSFVVGRDGKIAWIGHPMALEPVLKQILAGAFDPVKAAAQQVAERELQDPLGEAMRTKNWDKAIKLLDEYDSKNPAPQIIARFIVLLGARRYDEAYAMGPTVLKECNDNAQELNNLAWRIATDSGVEKRDLALAEKMAVRAVELTQSHDAANLDTLARVYFERGQIDKAIEFEIKAVDLAPPDLKPELQDALKKYQQAKGAGI